jgi:hypothetical protein
MNTIGGAVYGIAAEVEDSTGAVCGRPITASACS